MSLADIIILVSILVITGFLIYYNFYKKNLSNCSGCVHRGKCQLKGEDLKNYYKTQRDNHDIDKMQV